MLVIENDREAVRKYWDIQFEQDGRSPQHHVQCLRQTLTEAVEHQLRSDVPVGTYLSGGIDTGAISAIARAKLGRMHSFTCGFDAGGGRSGDDRSRDERAEARELALRLGTDHHEIELTPADMPRLIPHIAWHLEDARAGISYQNYATAELVSRHAVVVMSGVGGDELFAGYPWRLAKVAALQGKTEIDRAYYTVAARLLDDEGREAVLSQKVRKDLGGFRPLDSYQKVMAGCLDENALNRALYFDAKGFLRALLIVEDKLSMAHSVEARVPLLDNDMIHRALALPPELRYANGRSKVALREAMTGLLPERQIQRRKQGFTPPDATWFRGPSRPYVEGILTSERFLDRGYFSANGVRQVLDAHFEGRADRRFLLWSMMLFEWMNRLFLDPSTPLAPDIITT